MTEWDVATCRGFTKDHILALEMRCKYNIEEMATFIDIARLCRMIVTHLAEVLCCYAITGTKSQVTKQTNDSGGEVAQWDYTSAYNKLILILGIYEMAAGRWLDRSSGPTSGGVGVYNCRSGSRDDNPMTVPARYDLPHAGDAMILRCDRYKSETPHPRRRRRLQVRRLVQHTATELLARTSARASFAAIKNFHVISKNSFLHTHTQQ